MKAPVLVIICLIAQVYSEGYGLSDEMRLIKYLLDKYDGLGSRVRPVRNSTDIMSVEFGLRLIQMTIDEQEQVLRTSAWIRLRWYDEFLVWDPEDFGGIYKVTLKYSDIWTPDITLVNTATADINRRPFDIYVKSTGYVFWAPHEVFSSACVIDVTDYPYDQHTCDMWFQSVSQPSTVFTLNPYYKSPWDLDTYLDGFKKSQEWEILKNESRKLARPRDEGAILMWSRRVSLKFTLTVRRRVGFTAFLLLTPCVALSFMTLAVFCLPPERPDRNSLAMSLFGSFMFLLLILIEVAPPTPSSVPKLGLYYGCNLLIIIAAIFLSVTVIAISRRGENGKAPPILLAKIFRVLSKPVFMGERGKGLVAVTTIGDVPLKPKSNQNHPVFVGWESGGTVSTIESASKDPLTQHAGTLGKIEMSLAKLQTSLSQPRISQINSNARNQWKIIADVIDRWLIVAFLGLNVLVLGLYYPMAR